VWLLANERLAPPPDCHGGNQCSALVMTSACFGHLRPPAMGSAAGPAARIVAHIDMDCFYVAAGSTSARDTPFGAPGYLRLLEMDERPYLPRVGPHAACRQSVQS
jgi:hypothetical protein